VRPKLGYFYNKILTEDSELHCDMFQENEHIPRNESMQCDQIGQFLKVFAT